MKSNKYDVGKHNKGLFLRLSVLAFIFLGLLFNCQKLDLTNPLDSKTEAKADSWAPKNMKAEALNDQEVVLSWESSDKRVEGYRIQRSLGNEAFLYLCDVDSGMSYIDTALIVGKIYFYKVAAFAGKNESEYTVIDSAIKTVFPAPSNLKSAAIDDQRIKLTWIDNCTFETGFHLERASTGSAWALIASLAANLSEYTDTGLSYGESYSYRIKAYTAKNESEYAPTDSLIKVEIPKPSNLTATASNDYEIKLTWTDNCSFESGYRLERASTGSAWALIASLAANVSEYTDTDIIYGQEYIYRVKAYTSQNESDYSNETLSLAWIVIAPSDLSLTRDDETTLTLTWADNSDFEEGFEIEKKIGNGSWSILASKPAGSTSHRETNQTPDEIYTYRVKATSHYGDSDWSEEILAKGAYPAIKDIDGNVYKTVKIGNQVWMAENLKVTHYRVGTAIPNVTDNSTWTGLTSGASCYYNNDATNGKTYGALYNWYAVDDSRQLAPEGWHIPTDEEWKELEMFLGMSQTKADSLLWRDTDEGKKLKSTSGWNNNNGVSGNGTDEVGFYALPGGFRNNYNGYFDNMGLSAYFWSASEYDANMAWYRKVDFDMDEIYRYDFDKLHGYSIRCVKD